MPGEAELVQLFDDAEVAGLTLALVRHQAGGLEVRVVRRGSALSTLEPGLPVGRALESAVAAARTRLDSLLTAREEAAASEVERAFIENRLEAIMVDLGMGPQRMYRARATPAGPWGDPEVSPRLAIRALRPPAGPPGGGPPARGGAAP